MLFIKIKSGECFFFSSGKLFPDLGVGTCWERNLLVAKETCTPDERIPCTRCYAGIFLPNRFLYTSPLISYEIYRLPFEDSTFQDTQVWSQDAELHIAVWHWVEYLVQQVRCLRPPRILLILCSSSTHLSSVVVVDRSFHINTFGKERKHCIFNSAYFAIKIVWSWRLTIHPLLSFRLVFPPTCARVFKKFRQF